MTCRMLQKETKSDVRHATEAVLMKLYQLVGTELFGALSQSEYNLVKEYIA
jgi:hypothetical protein